MSSSELGPEESSDTSTSPVESKDKADDSASPVEEKIPSDVQQLCREMFAKTADYLQGELVTTSEDYKLLEQMNKATSNKYSEMRFIASGISKAMAELNEKYRGLQSYLQQIDEIEESVSNLEQAAYKIDAYSKRLEAKYKQLERQWL